MSTRTAQARIAIAPLRTTRLLLRPFQPGDLEQLQRIVEHPSVRAFSPVEPRALAAAARAQGGRKQRQTAHYEFAVVVHRTGQVAGSCELVLGPGKSGEIGYLLGRRHWGYGYGTETARALAAFGFEALGLRQIHATVSLDNSRSRRVLQKAGFSWDALLRRAGRSAGPALDAERYIRLRDTPDRGACPKRTTRR